MVVFKQRGCIGARVAVIGKKWKYSAKAVVFGKKVDVFVQSGCNNAKWLHSGKRCCILADWLYSGKS